MPSLVSVVDQRLVRAVPGFFSRFAIEGAGTADKPILVAVTVGLAVLFGSWLGPAARRRPALGPAVFAAFGLLAVACAWSLGGAPVAGTALGAAVAAVVGAVTLGVLLAALGTDLAAAPVPPVAEAAARPDVAAAGLAPAEASGAAAADLAPAARPDGTAADLPPVGQAGGTAAGLAAAPRPTEPLDPTAAVDRRRFVTTAGVVAGTTALGLVAARQLGRPGIAAAQRARIRLPAARASSEAGVLEEEHIAGLSRFITPNRDFYRIDEALVVPSVDVRSWRLRITGMVDTPVELTYDELLALPQIERPVTLACVSNEVGGRLVGTARWSGVRLGDLLQRAGVRPAASQVVGRSVDGFTVGFPTDVALDGRDALVALGMNGEPLPLDHGFPARLVVPGLYGYVSATKWLKEIELTTWDAFDAYWVERGWDGHAPIKVQSRVDVPRDYTRAKAGRVAVAGVAWAPRHGIAAVDVRVDGGPWLPTRLGPSLGNDVWRQWVHDWDAAVGVHVIEVRATTADGEVQPDTKHAAFPNGATGHHEAHVRVVP